MNKDNIKLKIALIGSYPPPYGGISVHISRLKEKIKDKGYECVVYAPRTHKKGVEKNVKRIKSVKRWMFRYFFHAEEDIIHQHNPSWQMRIMMGLMGLLGKKTIVSIHGESLRDSLKEGSSLKKETIKFALRHTPYIIVLNPKTKELVLSLQVKPERVKVIPSFIPPVIKEEEIAQIPNEAWHFIKTHTPIIAANAFKIKFYNDYDLYGIDMCVDLCANLKNDYPEIGLVFSLPDIGDYEYFQELNNRIVRKGIEGNFLFVTRPYPFYPILMNSDVFVRPTNIDGYGISIAEAIYFKIPALASDVCVRPEGTILFKSRDTNDFTAKVKDVLENYKQHKRRLDGVNLENYFEKIIEIYQRVATND